LRFNWIPGSDDDGDRLDALFQLPVSQICYICELFQLLMSQIRYVCDLAKLFSIARVANMIGFLNSFE
jgi:hypothetical protein